MCLLNLLIHVYHHRSFTTLLVLFFLSLSARFSLPHCLLSTICKTKLEMTKIGLQHIVSLISIWKFVTNRSDSNFTCLFVCLFLCSLTLRSICCCPKSRACFLDVLETAVSLYPLRGIQTRQSAFDGQIALVKNIYTYISLLSPIQPCCIAYTNFMSDEEIFNLYKITATKAWTMNKYIHLFGNLGY